VFCGHVILEECEITDLLPKWEVDVTLLLVGWLSTDDDNDDDDDDDDDDDE